MTDTIKALTEQIDSLKAENERLKKKVSSLETPDMFWLDAEPDWSFASIAEAMDYNFLEVKKIRRAVSLPDIWVVLEEKYDEVIDHEFPTKEEAEKFCQKMREAQND